MTATSALYDGNSVSTIPSGFEATTSAAMYSTNFRTSGTNTIRVKGSYSSGTTLTDTLIWISE